MSHVGYEEAVGLLRDRTGVIIPTHFPRDADPGFFRAMLRDTAAAFAREMADAKTVCLSVDGQGPAVAHAEAVAEEVGVTVCVSEKNRGKLSALRHGMACMADRSGLEYIAAADQDGDHFANELLNLVRAARDVEAKAGTERIMVLGRRISRHRPMGFLRGELEELADRVLLDALHYDAAVTARPLPMQFATSIEEFPDFHSGYKLFTRATADDVFGSEPNLAGMSETCYYRHAVEAVICVESVKSAATLVTVNRSTWDEQPVSTFALLDRRRMIADKIIWPCKRLTVPGEFVAQWVDNHLPRLQLGTLVPDGRDELLDIRGLVREAFGISDGEGTIERTAFV